LSNSFSVSSTRQGDITILAVTGYLDAHTAPRFEKTIQDEFDAGRYKVIVDCSGLTYISSAGLGVFMSFVEDVRDKGGDIKICALTDSVYSVFDILGFPALFDIVPDQAAAVQKFSEPARKES
jgi:anti-sigma B factor antagonist